MASLCCDPTHIPHIWPTLPLLEKDHMIHSCEQYCQWCPSAVTGSKQWSAATNLRKHAKCHLAKDPKFTIQGAGKGGRRHIIVQDQLVDTPSLHYKRIQEAALKIGMLAAPAVAEETLPDPTPPPAPASPVQDPSTTSSELLGNRPLRRSASPEVQLTTRPLVAQTENPLVSPSPPSRRELSTSSEQSLTSSPLVLDLPASPKDIKPPLGLSPSPKPTQEKTSRRQVQRPSLQDNSELLDSSPSRDQKPSGRSLVPSRRTRSAASVSSPSTCTCSAKRVK